MNEVKFSVFADFHCLPGYFCTKIEGLDFIRDRAIENGADFVIHVGDLTHEPSKHPDIVKRFEDMPLPTYHCIGNHEFEGDTLQKVLDAYHLEKPYYYFDVKGFRFIVLDLNCMRIKGETIHYEKGNFFTTEEKDLVTFDEEQFAWLEKTIMESNYPCIIFSHHSLERAYSGMNYKEIAEVRKMLNRVNEDKQRVLLCINGHYHRDYLRIRDNIAFFDLNASSGEWLGKPHTDRYPKEVYEQSKYAGNNIMWDDPVHAIVTLRDDGYIKIEGMKSRFSYGVDHRSLGLRPIDGDGRECLPEVLSAEFKLFLK